MPIIEANLDKKLEALLELESGIRANLADIRHVRSNLYEIKKTIQKIPDPDNPGQLIEELIIPDDRRTKKPFTAAARQKIYDDNIVLANKLLT